MKSTKIIIIAVFLMNIFACNKDSLNTAPNNTLSDATAFSTPERFRSLINGIYDHVKSGNFYGSRYVVYQDIRGEEFLNELNNAVTGLQTWNHTVNSNTTEVNTLWEQCYRTINSCNIFIDGLSKNKSVLNNQSLADNYEGEAKFVRALCYYTLLNIYCRPYADGNGSKLGVILRLTPAVDATGNDVARSTVEECYVQIIKDLNDAEQKLPLSYAKTSENVTRAHKNAAIALKTRVYLAQQKWSDVITEANKIVPISAPFAAATGVKHALNPSIATTFSNFTTTESIFSMPYTDTDAPGTQNALNYYWSPPTKGNGEYSLNPSGIIADTVFFKKSDSRRGLLTTSGTKTYCNKFPNGPGAAQLDYTPIIRYSEVLLNLSEAIARSTNSVDSRAVSLLDAVHKRSDATWSSSFANVNDLIDSILKERRVELLGEGFRAADCVRLLVNIPGKSNVAAQLPSSAGYTWPIPSSELATNKLCVP